MERVDNRSVEAKNVVIVGAGWAGISTALTLVQSGVPAKAIQILERAPHGGGRAFSFRDKPTGLDLDNGQHVLLGCCDAFIDMLNTCGVKDGVRFQETLRVPVYINGHRQDIVSRRLPGPLHLLPGLLNYRHLTVAERTRALSIATQFLHKQGNDLDEVSFAEWLSSLGQTERVISDFWDLLGTAVLNGHAYQISARLAAEAFRIGVVAGYSQARLGLFETPLGELADAALNYLSSLGVKVRYSSLVERIHHDGHTATALYLRGGERLDADMIVSAVPHDALHRMLPRSWQEHPYMRAFANFRWSPILNVFVLYDRPVMDDDLFASMDAGGMFVFNRGRLIHREHLDGRWLSVSISAADSYRALARDEMERMVLDAIERASPVARVAQVVEVSTVWQPLATFLAEPGTWSKRPTAKTPFHGLVLAGDWTDTGWPACLEGAVRSGHTAAQQVLLGS